MTVELIRHGATAYVGERRYQGQTDVPLSPEGISALQADVRPLDRVYVSPMKRAQQTASVLFPAAVQIPVPGLEEMNFGDFEGRTPDEMETDEAYRSWVDSGCEDPCPTGESKEEFSRRACSAFAALLDDALARGEEEVVIVAHGGVLMAVMDRFSLPRRPYFSWHCSCGGSYILDAEIWQSEWCLRLISEKSYLK